LTEKEAVDIVDAQDRILGRTTLDDCYSKGLLHRAVSIYAWDNKGQVLLQRRSLHDDWFPGYWTSSCTGHVRAGEDWREASRRELQEELGIKIDDLSLLFDYVVPPIRYGELIEYEMMYVVETNIRESKITIDPVEVEEVRSFSSREFRNFFETNQSVITPDAIETYRRYVKIKG